MADGVTFGLWYDFRNPAPWAVPFERLYAETLEQIAAAEGMGFGSVWLTEHHFCADGYTPSPMVIGAAIASRTRHMRIGTNLIILPLHNPIRVAEDAATLSIISGGRFDLGVGVGYRQLEFDAFGRTLTHRPSLMEESVEILRRAWRGEAIEFSGKRFEIGDLKVTPVPATPLRIFMGGMTEVAIDRAARIADGFLSTGGIGHDLYEAALERNNNQAGAIYAGNWAIAGDDPERLAHELGDHILYQSNEYIKWGAFGPPEETPLFEDAASAIENGLYELWDADTAIRSLKDLLGANPHIRDVHFWGRFPGESLRSSQRRIEFLANKVLPNI